MTSRWDRRLKWAVKLKKFEHLPCVTLKGLRHTHATILMELGVPPQVVQERLRHSTITTTMNIYGHVARPCRRTPSNSSRAASPEREPGDGANQGARPISRPITTKQPLTRIMNPW